MSYDYEQTHENIIKSAKNQFREKGFREASIRSICNDAGVTNGAFYSHFESKEDLFSQIVNPCIEGLNALYADEKNISLNIRDTEDILKAFERTYNSTGKLIEYVCKNREDFLLILESSDGTVYENFLNSLIESETNSMSSFLKLSKKYINNPKNISNNIIKMGASFLINTVFECLRNGMDAEDIRQETKLVSDYCMAGYKYLLGI